VSRVASRPSKWATSHPCPCPIIHAAVRASLALELGTLTLQPSFVFQTESIIARVFF
jgi:hypothetical protein